MTYEADLKISVVSFISLMVLITFEADLEIYVVSFINLMV
jgi:hypothetical protein